MKLDFLHSEEMREMKDPRQKKAETKIGKKRKRIRIFIFKQKYNDNKNLMPQKY